MKKRTKIIRIIISIILILGIGMGVGVKIHMDHEKQELREKQINYLKDHQQEIIDFVKKQDKRIFEVSIDWSQTNVGTIENGLPYGEGEAISIYGDLNNNKESQWSVLIKLSKEKGVPIMKSINLDGLSMEEDDYE